MGAKVGVESQRGEAADANPASRSQTSHRKTHRVVYLHPARPTTCLSEGWANRLADGVRAVRVEVKGASVGHATVPGERSWGHLASRGPGMLEIGPAT